MPIKKIYSLIKGNRNKKPVLIPRDEHIISRKNISRNALNVLYRLHHAGYQTHLVGGCVRDLLLGREPKDFDIATNATPHQIKQEFVNARIIGRRFRLVHVSFRYETIEVTTFRTYDNEQINQHTSKEGMLLRDNVYGTIYDDANRRDFTVNGLYYNIADFSVIDFHNGLNDLKKGILRVIGDAKLRYREDPVRMLRAVRFAAKLGFRMDIKTEKPLYKLRTLLINISPARLFTEVLKLFLCGQALDTFKQLRHYRMLEFLYPQTEKALRQRKFAQIDQFISLALIDTDQRILSGKTVSPAYIIAVFLWYPFLNKYRILCKKKHYNYELFDIAYDSVMSEQQKAAAAPKHFLLIVKSIWELQFIMENTQQQNLITVVNHPRFRAAYDFLKQRANAGEAIPNDIIEKWKDFYHHTKQLKSSFSPMIEPPPSTPRSKSNIISQNKRKF